MNIIPQDIPLKQCKACKEFFPATLQFFGKHTTTKDRLRTECKECRKVQTKVYNDAHIEQRKQRYQEHREEILQKTRQYRTIHSEEVREKRRTHYKANREHRIELSKRYAQRHREDVLARARRYHWKHREQAIKRMKTYRNAHREEYIEQDRRYYATHREQRHAYRKSYQEKHYEQLREKQKAYLKTEQGRIAHRAAWHRREARKKAIEGTLTTQQIQAKLKAQKYTCYYCSTKFEKRNDKYIFHLEHTIPLSRVEHSPRHDINYVVLSCSTCNLKKGTRLPHEWYQGGRLF